MGGFTDSTVTLNSSGGPTIDNTTVIDPSCGLSDGSIDILASGGTGTLLYSINNGTSFQGRNKLYQFAIWKLHGCNTRREHV